MTPLRGASHPGRGGTAGLSVNVSSVKLLDQIGSEMDPNKRQQMIRQEQEYIRQHMPVAYLVQMGDIYGRSKKADWWKPRADEKVWLGAMFSVW